MQRVLSIAIVFELGIGIRELSSIWKPSHAGYQTHCQVGPQSSQHKVESPIPQANTSQADWLNGAAAEGWLWG